MRAARNLHRLFEGRTPLEAIRLLVIIAVVVGGFGYACHYCMWDSYDRSLLRGHAVIVEMTGEPNLEKAGFYDAYPDGSPSDFVEFMDSEEGEAYWPPTNREYRQQFEHPDLVDEPQRALSPNNLVYVAHRPDDAEMRQLVYIPDDDAGQLELIGYRDPGDAPLYEWTVDFPSDADEIDF